MTRKHIVSSDQAEELVHRVYKKASAEEPGKELDDIILAEARKGLESEPKENTRSPLQVWQRFGSVAATLVVVVTVGLVYHENRHELSPENPVRLMSEPTAGTADLDETSESIPANMPEESAPPPAISSDVTADKVHEEAHSLSDSISEETTMEESLPARPAKKLLKEQRSVPADQAPVSVTADTGEDQASGLSGSALPAPAPKAESQEFAPAMQRMMKAAKPDTYQQKLHAIRNAIAAGDIEEARTQWDALKAAYPDASHPEDLIHFFGNNDQIGEAEQVDGDAGSGDNQ